MSCWKKKRALSSDRTLLLRKVAICPPGAYSITIHTNPSVKNTCAKQTINQNMRYVGLGAGGWSNAKRPGNKGNKTLNQRNHTPSMVTLRIRRNWNFHPIQPTIIGKRVRTLALLSKRQDTWHGHYNTGKSEKRFVLQLAVGAHLVELNNVSVPQSSVIHQLPFNLLNSLQAIATFANGENITAESSTSCVSHWIILQAHTLNEPNRDFLSFERRIDL